MKYTQLLALCSLLMAGSDALRTMEAPVQTQAVLPQGPVAPADGKAERKDIANKEVRPDVYQAVSKMVDPVPQRRRKNPPPKPREWDEGYKKDADDDSFAKKNKK